MINVIDNIRNIYGNVEIGTTTIVSVLLVAGILATYEFLIYRFVSHRCFYNKQFNICISLLPFFISTIILCLQSNIVITLGTIGALAIIRFRTAVKDPVDMIYILWSIYIGIICGCQLYEVAVLTSVAVTIILLLLENISLGKLPYVLIIHTDDNEEEALKEVLDKYTKKHKIKSRNYTSKGMDYAIELSIKDPDKLTNSLKKCKFIENFSIIEYDSEDII